MPPKKNKIQLPEQKKNQKQKKRNKQSIIEEEKVDLSLIQSKDKKQNQNNNADLSVSYSVNSEQNIQIKIAHRIYTVNPNCQFTKKQSEFLIKVDEKYFKDNINEFLTNKMKLQDQQINKITSHSHYTAYEYYISHMIDKIEYSKNKQKHGFESEKCSICQYEWYEQIEKFTLNNFQQQLKENKDSDMVQLNQCSHCFHIECLQMCIQGSHIKCPICYTIYGIQTGDQPPGTMTHNIQRQTHCAGFEKFPTIVINFHFPSGAKKDGTKFSGTSRTAYMPDTPKFQRILRLLYIAFERKLIFTIGTSVTTGQQNTTIWNGIHFKTNTHGGSSNFGFPDDTYPERILMELAMKGVVDE